MSVAKLSTSDKFSSLADWIEKALKVTHAHFSDLEDVSPCDISSIEVDVSDLKPPHAALMTGKDMVTELEMRGITPTYFPADDVRLLQPILDKEHINTIAETKAKRFAEAKAAMEAKAHAKKRIALEARMQEELEVLAGDPETARWANSIAKENVGIVRFASIKVDSIGARAIAKAMWKSNCNIRVLNLCHNDLDDHAAAYISRMLERNGTLEKLELDHNRFGPKTLVSLSKALLKNKTLKALTLEANPLVPLKGEANECTFADRRDLPRSRDSKHSMKAAREMYGIEALGRSLAENYTLRTLILFHTGIDEEAGKLLVTFIKQNKTLQILDLRGNAIATKDIQAIEDNLQHNRDLYMLNDQNAKMQLEEQKKSEEKEVQRVEKEAKTKERDEWLDERAQRRAARRKREEIASLAKAAAQVKEREEKELIYQKVLAEKKKHEKKGKKGKGKKKK